MARVENARLKIQVVGEWKVFVDGKPVEIGLAKSAAILALLALSRDKSEGRDALRKLLWDREPRDQQMVSLNQALYRLRDDLGAARVCIKSDRKDVWLVDTDLDAGPAGRIEPSELLRGLHVPHCKPLDDWIVRQRGKLAAAVAQPEETRPAEHCADPRAAERVILKKLPVFIDMPQGCLSGSADFQLESLIGDISTTLKDRGDTVVFNQRTDFMASETGGSTGVRIRAKVEEGDACNRFSFQVREIPNERFIWSKPFHVESAEGLNTAEAHAFVVELSDRLLEDARNLSLEAAHPSLLLAEAQRLIATLDKEKCAQADVLLSRATEQDPRNGVYYAWRSYLRSIWLLERHKSGQDVKEQGLDFMRRAIDYDPYNSIVLGLGANVASGLERKYELSKERAYQSVKYNPANPIALSHLGVAESYLGDLSGVERTRLARDIGAGSRMSFMLEARTAVAMALAQRFDEARYYAALSYQRAENYAPPLRYLVALSFEARDEAAAYRYADALRKIEPEFVVDHLRDPAYPAEGIHQSGLVNFLPAREI